MTSSSQSTTGAIFPAGPHLLSLACRDNSCQGYSVFFTNINASCPSLAYYVGIWAVLYYHTSLPDCLSYFTYCIISYRGSQSEMMNEYLSVVEIKAGIVELELLQ